MGAFFSVSTDAAAVGPLFRSVEVSPALTLELLASGASASADSEPPAAAVVVDVADVVEAEVVKPSAATAAAAAAARAEDRRRMEVRGVGGAGTANWF